MKYTGPSVTFSKYTKNIIAHEKQKNASADFVIETIILRGAQINAPMSIVTGNQLGSESTNFVSSGHLSGPIIKGIHTGNVAIAV